MNQFFLRLFVPVLALTLGGCGLFPKSVKVGSKNTTTQMVLGEITAQHLEAKGMKIVRRIGMGNTAIVHQATLSGDIDIYPEDTGFAISAMLKENPIQDREAQYERVRNEYERLYGLRLIRPLGAGNAPVAVVPEALAAKNGFSTISDATEARSMQWRLGMTEEFSARTDGMQAFSSNYKFQQKEAPRTLDTSGLYQALLDGQLDLIIGGESDGLLSGKGTRILKDDKRTFAPGQLCLLVRRDAASANPELEKALAELSGKLPTDTLRGLCKEIEVDKRPLEAVAGDFLKKAGLR